MRVMINNEFNMLARISCKIHYVARRYTACETLHYVVRRNKLYVTLRRDTLRYFARRYGVRHYSIKSDAILCKTLQVCLAIAERSVYPSFGLAFLKVDGKNSVDDIKTKLRPNSGISSLVQTDQ